MTVFVGDDWAEAHHDVAWLPEGLKGIVGLHALVAEHAADVSEVVIGIETERGLWVQALIAARVSGVCHQPRCRCPVTGTATTWPAPKSDPGDATVLADLVRTDRHNHRPIAGDSDAADAIKILARAHQNLIWERTRHTNRLRNTLREYFPAATEAFSGPVSPRCAWGAALKRSGRQRNLDHRAAEIQAVVPPAVTAAFASTTKSAIGLIGKINAQITLLEAELASHFYDSAKSRRNYAGTSPLTIASGRKKAVLARHRRLYDAIDQWAFCSLQTSPGCRDFYDQRRAAGDLHHQALRALGNRLVGYIHGCLRTRSHYNEHTAWAHRQQQEIQQAA